MTTKDGEYAAKFSAARRQAILLNQDRHQGKGGLQCVECRRTYLLLRKKLGLDVFHKKEGRCVPGVPLDQAELEVLCGECFEEKHNPPINEYNWNTRIQEPMQLPDSDWLKQCAAAYAKQVANEALYQKAAKKRR